MREEEEDQAISGGGRETKGLVRRDLFASNPWLYCTVHPALLPYILGMRGKEWK